ncbi:MAG: hypothetical protein AMXMBFR59_41080 [Rhodanobacteraceae bacterium]
MAKRLKAQGPTEAPRGKGGRPPRNAGEKMDQFSIRLTPKLRYGLELLARAQRGRPLSQVVEWALQRALDTTSLDGDGDPLRNSIRSLLDYLWMLDTEWERIQALHEHAPELLSFKEKSIFDFIDKSAEKALLSKIDPMNTESGIENLDSARANAIHERHVAREALHKIIVASWEEITSDDFINVTLQKARGNHSLLDALALPPYKCESLADLGQALPYATGEKERSSYRNIIR